MTNAPSIKLASLYYDMKLKTDGLKNEVAETKSKLSEIATYTKAHPVAAFVALGAAIVGVGLKAASMAADVEKGITRVTSIVPTGSKGVGVLRQSIEDLSLSTGRSQVELSEFAAAAAEMGAETAEDVANRLRIATTAADATGSDVGAILEGLDGLMDIFGLSSEEAADKMGDLFAAARGKASLDELLGSMKFAAPAALRLGLDVDTAGKAMIALGESLGSTRKAGAEIEQLGKLGAEGKKRIEELAASVTSAGGGFETLQEAADKNNQTFEVLKARIGTQFSAIMVNLGRAVLPIVEQGLIAILAVLNGIGKAASAVGSVFRKVFGSSNDVRELDAVAQNAASGGAKTSSGGTTSSGTPNTFKFADDIKAAPRLRARPILSSSRTISRRLPTLPKRRPRKCRRPLTKHEKLN